MELGSKIIAGGLEANMIRRTLANNAHSNNKTTEEKRRLLFGGTGASSFNISGTTTNVSR